MIFTLRSVFKTSGFPPYDYVAFFIGIVCRTGHLAGYIKDEFSNYFVPIEMWRVTGLGEEPDAGERDSDCNFALVRLFPCRVHLLAVSSELLTCCDEAFFSLCLETNHGHKACS